MITDKSNVDNIFTVYLLGFYCVGERGTRLQANQLHKF